jgi:ABC-2 type transport system ATP-binding protein
MSDNAAPIIEVQNLKKTFGTVEAVRGVSFSVKRGEVFAFLGPNGAGKTTTIKMLTTLLTPTSGSIRVNGIDPRVDSHGVRKSIGIVFQDPSLDDELTAWENLEIHGVLYSVPREVRRKRAADLLKVVGLSERKDDLVRHFSGGMKRRLEIARGLLHHPAVLFLDEPTVGLDPQTRNLLWSYVADLNTSEGITVFFTTHYLEEAEKNAQRIAVIDYGNIIAEGTVATLLTRTKTTSLEEAFLTLTGHAIREESASAVDRLRQRHAAWSRR